MKKILKNIWNGFLNWGLSLSTPKTYQIPNNGFIQDRQALKGDFNQVTQNLNRQIERYAGNYK